MAAPRVSWPSGRVGGRDTGGMQLALADIFRPRLPARAVFLPLNDFNTGEHEGCSYFQVKSENCGVRWNASKNVS